MPRTASSKIKSVRAVDRAIEILQCFSIDKPSMSVVELQKKVRLSRPTLYRLLHTLTAKGVVRADGAPQRFALDRGVAHLAYVWFSTFDAAEAAEPILAHLRDQTGETTALCILRDSSLTCVLQMASPHALSIARGLGYSGPVYRGASGKAVLAFMSEETIAHVLRHLPEGINRKRLQEDLVRVRENGFAMSQGEVIVGGLAIAAPFFDKDGGVVGSILVHGPQVRLGNDWIMRSTKLLLAGASQLSRTLGYTKFSQAMTGATNASTIPKR